MGKVNSLRILARDWEADDVMLTFVFKTTANAEGFMRNAQMEYPHDRFTRKGKQVTWENTDGQ